MEDLDSENGRKVDANLLLSATLLSANKRQASGFRLLSYAAIYASQHRMLESQQLFAEIAERDRTRAGPAAVLS